MRARIALILALVMTVVVPQAVASTPAIPAATGPDSSAPAARAAVQDDLLQITINRLHAEATSFFRPDSRSISVIRLDDGHLASADGDVWHISLSAAKAVWVVAAVQASGMKAVRPYARQIFQQSSNGAASRVISLVGPATSKGADAINAATWSWGLEDTYLYGWYNAGGTNYGYHRASKPLPGWKGSIQMWWTNNFTTTNDLAGFWAMLARGDLLGRANTARVLQWGALPRSHDRNELVPNRLPAGVAADVSHKAGWNNQRTRRIDGGVVTTPGGTRYAIAVSFRTPHESEYWGGGADWARYASCEIYNLIAGTNTTCTRTGDPAAIINHSAGPIGSLKSASGERDRLRVSGWALDRDAGADPIDVRISVDGHTVATVTADRLKTSIQRRYRLGNYHGFRSEFAVKLPRGSHRVCATAVNDSAGGGNSSIGCRTITVSADHPPTGTLLGANAKPDSIIAWGRAKDADTTEPIMVKLTLDGTKLKIIKADRGTNGHRFTLRLHRTVAPGEHRICAIALNYHHEGPNRTIGCRTVVVPDDGM